MDEFCVDNVVKYFAPQGPMERIIPAYKYRDEQAHLTAGIVDAFINQEFLLAEVGTGVGKTFAYLIPAVWWSVQQEKRVIMSTRTKALQQQIVERDIPDVKKILGCEFNYVEAKGRENFLCWNKYMNILAGKTKLDDSEQEFMAAVLQWAEKTRTGDRKELGLSSELMKNWGLLAADRQSCQKDKCRYHEKCFRLKLMRKLEKAHIIVVNHALLLSDMLVDNSILPEYHYLVIDEAHSFDREAFDKLSLTFSYGDIMEVLKILYQKDKKNQRGYLQYLRARNSHIAPMIDEAGKLLLRAIELTEELYSVLSKSMGGVKDYGFSHVLQNADLRKPWFSETVARHREWQDNMFLLIKRLKDIQKEIPEQEEDGELDAMIDSLQEFSDRAFEIVEENSRQAEKIVWIDYNRGRAMSISSSPVRIGEELNKYLYEKLESLVMVSATLAIEDKFDYFLGKAGLSSVLPEERVNTLLGKSPFDYDNQACLFTVKDLAEPGSPAYYEELCGVLADIFAITRGRTLVLFTSRRHLQETAAMMRPHCENNGIKLLAQYEDGEFGILVEKFTSCENAVLMGVETFWEGIDLKGDLLKCVVIIRLPFRAPSDPFCSAGDRYFKMQRKNSFQHFMLPDAAVRFKQGSGRLIRSENDRGVLIVLDSRLEKRSYGRVFKNSIPIKKTYSTGKSNLASLIKDWL